MWTIIGGDIFASKEKKLRAVSPSYENMKFRSSCIIDDLCVFFLNTSQQSHMTKCKEL